LGIRSPKIIQIPEPKFLSRSIALAQNVYEGLFIFDSTRFGRDQDGVPGQVNDLIEKLGGEVLVSRLWDERRLAYPINGQRKGTYWLTYFRLESTKLPELKQPCSINENILRVLFLRIEPRIVDALVNHARTAQVLAPPAETVAAAPAKIVAAGVELSAEELNVDLDEVE
jgi:small subunit ribosomal protein S6